MSFKNILNFFKKNKFILLIIIISLFSCFPLFQPGFISTHDGASQLIRSAARYSALLDGQFPVRWAADLNYGYGTPGLIFYYSLTGYLTCLLHFIGFTFEDGYKFLSVITSILAPITFYFFAKEIFKKEVAFVASMLYGLAPYGFLDMFVRGHLGESMALAIIPLVLFFMERNNKKITVNNIILGSVSYAFLVIAHGILSVIFTVVLLGYALFSSKKAKKLFFANALIVLGGLFLSSYKWIPAYFEGKYINSRLFVSDWYKDHFLNITNIIYSKWGFGDSVNKPGGLSAQIGPVHTAYAIFGLVLFKKLKKNILVLFWILVFLWAVFMSTSMSNFLWSRIHLIQQFQFPWRFTAVSMFSASVLAGYVLQYINNRKLMILTVLILLVLSLPMTKVIVIPSRGDLYYLNNPSNGSYHNEGTTIWTAGDPYEYPKNKVEVASGDSKIQDYSRRTIIHTFTVIAKTDSDIVDNTIYFPGWKVDVDNKQVPIQFQDPNHRGLIEFKVEKGVHAVKVYFTDTPIRFFSNIMTVIGTVFIVIYFLMYKFKIVKLKNS